jgi:hypothetical protein
MRPRLACAVEEPAGDVVQTRLGEKPRRGVHAVAEAADRAGDDLRGHVRGGVQRVGRHAGSVQLSGELDGEHHLREP